MPNNNNGLPPNHLEPRVAKLETGLEILTRDVTTLASVVREQGQNIEHELQRLAVGVAAASGPRKTDWATIISAIMLVMAIGSAVFWPLNQTAQNNSAAIQSIEQKFDEHQRLQLHPVGAALMQRLEGQLHDHIANNQRENDSQNAAWSKELDLLTERINARLAKLETNESDRNKSDLEELRALRLRVLTQGLTGLK